MTRAQDESYWGILSNICILYLSVELDCHGCKSICMSFCNVHISLVASLANAFLSDSTTSSVARFSCLQAVGCERSDTTPWMHHLFLRHETGWILQVLDPRQDTFLQHQKQSLPHLSPSIRPRSPRCWCIGLSLLRASKVAIDSVDNIIHRLFNRIYPSP